MSRASSLTGRSSRLRGPRRTRVLSDTPAPATSSKTTSPATTRAPASPPRSRQSESPRPMLVAGVMSGTSADGIDIAICRIGPAASARGAGASAGADPLRLKLLAHTAHPYPKAVREAVLAAMDARRTSTAELSRLHWRLGQLYADALAASFATTKLKPQLIALHGQTLYHQAVALPFLGQPTRCTWQAGEASVVAEQLRLPVISDFRPADLAAGGQGAPLVPMLDYTVFRHPSRNHVLLNLGGIANLTAIPAGAAPDGVLAFDTGPANMVIDALAEELFHKPFDPAGKLAAAGQVLHPVLERLLRNAFFTQPPPKSCGREEFGRAFAANMLSACRRKSQRKEDALATATALTATTIRDAYARFVWPHLGQRAPLARGTDLLVAGGGTHNETLMKLLTEAFDPLAVRVATTERFGLPSEAKEAAAFALLGWLTWHGLPGNIPSATGATRPVVLGRITPA